MGRRLSQEEFEAEIFSRYGDEYVIKSKYLGSKEPIEIFHKECKNTFTCNNSNNFKLGKSKCPYCTPCSNAINDDIFRYRVDKLVGDEYTVKSSYQKATMPIKFRHNKCCHPNGYFDFEMKPHSFFSGHRCPYESHQQEYTIDDFKNRLKEYHPDFECIGETYINSSTKIPVRCNNNHIFDMTLENIKNGCPYCSRRKVCKGENDLWTTHPHIAKLLKNPKDGYKYMYGTNTELDFICPNCGNLIHKKPYLLLNNHNKVICICSDGFSYPEKFLYNFLKQLDIDFIYQLSSVNYEWCGKYKYDFYITKLNLIIEVHGRQHYDGVMFYDPKDVQKNDKDKYDLAINNGCNYCVIDARLSEQEYIINSIKNSTLADIFDISNIDWQICDEFASSSILYDIVDLWNSESKNIQYISDKLKISDLTTYRYLERGNELNLCEFNKKEYVKYAKIKAHKGKIPVNAKQVMSVETGKKYKSIAEARRLCKAYLTPEIINNPNKTSAKQHWVYA